jgi:HEAT repeat protein
MVSFRQKKINKNLMILGDYDSSSREAAIDFLVRMGTSAVDPLVQALGDGESVVRESAAIALGRIGDKNTVTPLLDAIQNEKAGPAKAKMIKALGEIGGADVKDALFLMLEEDPSEWTFRCVIKVLDKAGIEPGSLEEKVYYFSAKEDWRAVLGLGDMAIQPFMSLIEATKVNPNYPHSGSLPRPTEQAKILAEFGESVIEPLLDAIVNAKGNLRIDAMWALAIKGDERAENPLINCLMEDDSALRLEAIGALGRLKSDKAAEPLVKILEDTNELNSARWTAAAALGQIASVDTVEPMIRVLFNDKRYETNRDIRDILLSSITKVKGPAKELCLKAPNDTTLDPDIHIRCNKILARI